MKRGSGFVRLAGLTVGFACLLCLGPAGSRAQGTLDEGFTTGEAERAWALWKPAMQAVLDRDGERAEQLFGHLLAQKVSPFRVALLAERTMDRTGLGGALLLLEEDYASDALGDNARAVFELWEQGREQMNEADDGWYFCSVGRFDVADANFRALLASDPDPVALLEFTDQVKRRREILLQLVEHETVGPAIRDLLHVLAQGEEAVKADPTRIRRRIERLGGSPREYENSVALLKDSGEYAIPFIVEALRDPERRDLTQAILRCLPEIDRPALNPLVYAIRVEVPDVKRYLVQALGQIGYPQAVPYLLQLRAQEDTPADLLAAIDLALQRIQQRNPQLNLSVTPAEAFYRLADAYYADSPSLAADPRLDTANVWYWRDDILVNVPVPTPIFNEVMCMRCCEEALRLEPDLHAAQALWIAANFRRAAQLPEGEADLTRPENNPSPAYFAQTSGPAVCLTALARALDDGDAAVALGVIEALRRTAGRASLVTDAGGRLPLAEALSFPDRMVRIQAALTLAEARPTKPFLNHQNVMPVLNEALRLHSGARSALVVDPDQESANALAALLRDAGYEVVSDTGLLQGLEKARHQLPAVDVILLASDVKDVPLSEALPQLRSEFRFSVAPVLVVAKPGQGMAVRELVQGDPRMGMIPADPDAEELSETLAAVARSAGVTPITPETGSRLALETARALYMLAVSDNPLFKVADARPALEEALATQDEELRLAVARDLAYVCEAEAQQALARVALDPDEPETTRVAFFDLLAEAAKHCGNLLDSDSRDQIVTLAEQAENMTIRTAASQALGALNLPGDKGSEIIRNQYGG